MFQRAPKNGPPEPLWRARTRKMTDAVERLDSASQPPDKLSGMWICPDRLSLSCASPASRSLFATDEAPCRACKT